MNNTTLQHIAPTLMVLSLLTLIFGAAQMVEIGTGFGTMTLRPPSSLTLTLTGCVCEALTLKPDPNHVSSLLLAGPGHHPRL